MKARDWGMPDWLLYIFIAAELVVLAYVVSLLWEMRGGGNRKP